jgi:serine protease AprX
MLHTLAWPERAALRKLIALVAVTATLLAVSSAHTSTAPAGATTSVIVRVTHGAVARLAGTVREAGGRITVTMPSLDAFAADVPVGAIPSIAQAADVLSITPDAGVHLLGTVDGVDPTKHPGSWLKVAKNTKLVEMWQRGWTGRGVDVALIDSGVAPVEGLALNVINGPDLSFESQADNLTNIDTYGHGTHLAGLIAGRDSSIRPGREDEDVDRAFVGAAPGARIVSLKVASSDGATDVSQILAAIDWVVAHRDTDGLNIRVLNLSFGTDSTQDYRLDPLAYAVEVAWLRGIVVVVSAGNGGSQATQLTDPAYDPYVIAVGADDTKGTDDPKDDSIPSFQSRGNAARHPDVVAPGKSLISLRDPGSFVDTQNPAARLGGSRFFKGSGSSQAAAVVSGAVATLLQQRPAMTPDQVKALLMDTAVPLQNADPLAQGSGLINLHNAREAKLPPASTVVQSWPRSTGLGTLQAARGSTVVTDDGVPLTGEQTIFGDTWDAATWAASSWDGTSWNGGVWSGRTWSGDCWCASGWAGRTWSGRTWNGNAWSGRTWAGRTWSGRTWSGDGWSAGSWDGTESPSALSASGWNSTIWGD